MLKVVIIGYGEMFTNLIAGALDANCNIVGVFRKSSIENSKFKNFFVRFHSMMGSQSAFSG